MTENEKLRALLVEARDGYVGHNLDCATVVCEECSFAARIDAALAEPVDDYDFDADLRLHKEDRLRLRAENLRLERERDEARAEIERLKRRFDAQWQECHDGSKGACCKAHE